jgi:hypothetical protein
VRLGVFLLAGVLGAAIHVWAADILLSGRVVDENDAAVAGARVRLLPDGQPESPAPLEVFADPTGGFTVHVPMAATYLVSAEHEGFFPLKDHSVQVGEGPREIHLVLNRADGPASVFYFRP